MAVYRPKRKAEASKFYVCEFVYHGKRFQESTGATSKTVAKEYEKRRKAELERSAAGLPTEQKANRIRTVSDVVVPYLEGYGLNHRPQSVLFAKGRLAQIERRLGDVILSDLTEERIKAYMRERRGDKASGRTINMELGELSRSIGQPWSLLWPKVRKLEERKDVGRALSPEEQKRLLAGLEQRRTPHPSNPHSRFAADRNAGRRGVILTWGQVELIGRTITVGRAKTSNGTGRIIPINDDLGNVFAHHLKWFEGRFGNALSAHHVFPWGKPVPSDPPPATPRTLLGGWDQLRKETGVSCRIHGLRQTFATRFAEYGFPNRPCFP